MKQQDGEEEKVNQALDLFPHGAVQGGVFANQIATKDERKVREEKLGVIHVTENNRT